MFHEKSSAVYPALNSADSCESITHQVASEGSNPDFESRDITHQFEAILAHTTANLGTLIKDC
jgi:hypothetical protein